MSSICYIVHALNFVLHFMFVIDYDKGRTNVAVRVKYRNSYTVLVGNSERKGVCWYNIEMDRER